MKQPGNVLQGVEMARNVKMSGEERMEQRIDFAHGNLPEELISSSKDLMRRTDEVMRSPGGWDTETVIRTEEIASTE